MAGYAEEATVQTDETGKKLNAGWWPVPYKAGKHIDANKNCYACISSSVKTQNPRTGEMRYWRGEASFGHGLALMVDDIGDGAGSKGDFTLEYFKSRLPPTVVVETSPGNFQLWYFLDEPEPIMRRFKAFLVAFVNNVLQKGGDNTIKDVARYGRMPCGVNNKRHSDGSLKYPDENGDPFNVRIRESDYSVRYSIDKIAATFGFTVVVQEKAERVEVDLKEMKIENTWLNIAANVLQGTGEDSGGVVKENGSLKNRIQCPWSDFHKNGDPYGAYFRGPIDGAEVDFVFGCAHDSCRKDSDNDTEKGTYFARKRTWPSFIDKVVMPYVEEALEEANANDIYGPKIKPAYPASKFWENFHK